jgi:mannose-6-phosphate isomerase-like protein (cupin superfamily)
MSDAELKFSDEEEAMHAEAEASIQNFKYAKPESLGDANKGLVKLCGSDILKGIVQIIEDGGENNLHFHEGMDSFWMVLKGSVAFYGPEDELIGEYGPMEGLLMPRGARYWFAKTSDDGDDLELLQVASYDEDTRSARRISVAGGKTGTNRNQWFDGQKGNKPIDKTEV